MRKAGGSPEFIVPPGVKDMEIVPGVWAHKVGTDEEYIEVLLPAEQYAKYLADLKRNSRGAQDFYPKVMEEIYDQFQDYEPLKMHPPTATEYVSGSFNFAEGITIMQLMNEIVPDSYKFKKALIDGNVSYLVTHGNRVKVVEEKPKRHD